MVDCTRRQHLTHLLQAACLLCVAQLQGPLASCSLTAEVTEKCLCNLRSSFVSIVTATFSAGGRC